MSFQVGILTHLSQILNTKIEQKQILSVIYLLKVWGGAATLLKKYELETHF